MGKLLDAGMIVAATEQARGKSRQVVQKVTGGIYGIPTVHYAVVDSNGVELDTFLRHSDAYEFAHRGRTEQVSRPALAAILRPDDGGWDL